MCDETTRLVSVSLVAFHTGFRAPVEAIGALCRSRGIVFGLDGIQAVGAQRVDVAGWGVDFLSADGHKWMLGPEGAGILFTSPVLRERLTPPAGWTNLDRASPTDYRVPETLRFRADGVRFEPGALPTPGLYALAASLGLLLEIGLPEVEARIARTLAVLTDGLPRLGFEPVLFGGPPRSGILAARPPGGEGGALLPEARRRGERRDLGARRLRPLFAPRRERRGGGRARARAFQEALGFVFLRMVMRRNNDPADPPPPREASPISASVAREVGVSGAWAGARVRPAPAGPSGARRRRSSPGRG